MVMENKDFKSLFDIQKSDLHSLEIQGFTDICTVKKQLANTNQFFPSGFTISYWWNSDLVLVDLIREDSGKYTIKVRGTTLRSHVPIDKVKTTLARFNVKIQMHQPYVVVERLKARRRKDNV